MAKPSKEYMATILKNSGYFWKYRYISDIVKEFSWDDLHTCYREYKANIGYPNID